MSSDLRWAVTDGPAGTAAVALPDDGPAAHLLDRAHGVGFWCSRQAGGCGGPLVLEAEDGVRPRFRHQGDTRCRYVGREADAGPRYDHLRYQRALAAWLAGQGHHLRVQKVPQPDGRTGLHVVVDDVGQAIEVQLAPLPDTVWRRRDDRYRRQVRHVTWLYGPAAQSAGDTEAAVRGVAYSVRRHRTGLLVGVRDVDGGTRWVPLGACRLTADGFAAPGATEARARHAERAAGRQEAARRAARCAARAAQQALGPGRGRRGASITGGRPPAPDLHPLPFPR
ncbi:competence protein CoiA family protein [Geodermatophilus sp. DF01_2]|uniref:competence protein CoiA family protein n=1 Tax=Geodermatophilus sp. DF01-2 TaxID=2559610 RepID=UPI0014303FE3|nr:competence protein CoiA family protein [Geodermatophilus sp. DF01_2]